MSELIARLLADPFVSSLLIGLAITGVGLWLAACWWVYRDAHRRSENGLGPYVASAWVFLSGPILLPLSLAVYGFARPQEPVAERRSRELLSSLDPGEMEADACPGCGREIDAAWRRCPTCAAWLGLRCDRCDRWAPMDAGICPWCAWEPGEATDPETLVVRPMIAVLEPVGAPAPEISEPAAAVAAMAVPVATTMDVPVATMADALPASDIGLPGPMPSPLPSRSGAPWTTARPRLVRAAPSIRAAFRGQTSAPVDRRTRERGSGEPAGGRVG